MFRRIYAKGKSAATSHMVLYCRKNGSQRNRLGITASTKLGNAVTRNRVRRRLREIYRTNEAKFLPGCDLIVVARHRSVEAQYKVLERDFLSLAGKLGVLR